jgi:hypothetical protein
MAAIKAPKGIRSNPLFWHRGGNALFMILSKINFELEQLAGPLCY